MFWHPDKWLSKMSWSVFFSQLALYSPYMLDGINQWSHLGLELSLWKFVKLKFHFLSWLFLLTILFLDGRSHLTFLCIEFCGVFCKWCWLWQLIFKSWNKHTARPFFCEAMGNGSWVHLFYTKPVFDLCYCFSYIQCFNVIDYLV